MFLKTCGRLALAALLCGALFPRAWAESEAAPQAGLSLRAALSRTLQSSPELAAYQHVLKAQDGRVTQAGLRPNPTLAVDMENVLGTGETTGFDEAELTLSLSQLIEFPALRERRVAVARHQRDALGIEAHIRRLDAIAETARRFIAVLAQQQAHALTHYAVELAEDTAGAVSKRVAAARSPVAERDRAEVALERAHSDDAHAEHQLLAARYALAASWGADQPDFERAAADLIALPEVADYDSLVAALDDTPDFEAYLSEQRLRESELRLALARRNPGIEVGAGLRRFQGTGDTALTFSLGVPLPFFDRSQGDAQTARAQSAGAVASGDAARVRARMELFRHYQELLDRRRQVRVLRSRALPLMESALQNTQYAYERGRYSYLELVDAQRELLDVRASLIESAAQYQLTLIEIERLTGNGSSRED